MLTPKEGMSPFQKAQAGSILDSNIYNVSIEGPFDDCQDIVKSVNHDLAFKKQHHIGAVNSINWGRILAQTIYYVRAYLSSYNQGHTEIDCVVPSGNFGNVLAGHVAKQMGVPIRRLIVSTNENKVLDHFFKTGIYQQTDVVVTSSPSMDISKASNLERFIFDLLGRGDTQLCDAMETFEASKRLDLSKFNQNMGFHHEIQSKYGFFSSASTHDEREDMIARVYKESQRIIDPHTASAVKVAHEYKIDDVPLICMETAKPAKIYVPS